jgi:hypothetical protein
MTIVGHNTINRFRSDKLKDSFREIFNRDVLMLATRFNYPIEYLY